MRLGVVMDPIGAINFPKDSSLALLLTAQERGWELYYMEPADLYLEGDQPMARQRRLQVFDDASRWFALQEAEDRPLRELDAILMRQDPPCDEEYQVVTWLLEYAERLGVLVVNRPARLRDCNEKVFAARFPECTPPLLVSPDIPRLRDFLAQHQDVIYKPLHGMGGDGVFRVRSGDPNCNAILESATSQGRRHIMAQRYVPEIKAGDKRIFLIDGQPLPLGLARIPQEGETRANLAAGGKGEAQPLSDSDRRICAIIEPLLRELDLMLVGIDVIGPYLTEINITSPTGIRELQKAGLDVATHFFHHLETRLKKTPSPPK